MASVLSSYYKYNLQESFVHQTDEETEDDVMSDYRFDSGRLFSMEYYLEAIHTELKGLLKEPEFYQNYGWNQYSKTNKFYLKFRDDLLPLRDCDKPKGNDNIFSFHFALRFDEVEEEPNSIKYCNFMLGLDDAYFGSGFTFKIFGTMKNPEWSEYSREWRLTIGPNPIVFAQKLRVFVEKLIDALKTCEPLIVHEEEKNKEKILRLFDQGTELSQIAAVQGWVDAALG